MKRNSLTAQILQYVSDCETEGNIKAKKKQKTRNRNTTLKICKKEVEPEVQTFQSQALEIAEPGPEFDPNAIPEDGMQFLMKMYYERQRCPVIVQCPLPDSKYSQTEATTTAIEMPDDNEKLGSNLFLTTPEWINAQTYAFLRTQSRVTLVRMKKPDSYVDSTEVDNELPTEASKENDWQEFCIAHEPSLSLILQFGQRQLELLLDYLSKWLKECIYNDEETANDLETTKEIAATSDNINLLGNKRWLGIWIYATLVCLELPLESQVYGTLREIARSCILLRSRLECDEEEMAQQYNVFVAIIVNVFEQYDFKDFL